MKLTFKNKYTFIYKSWLMFYISKPFWPFNVNNTNIYAVGNLEFSGYRATYDGQKLELYLQADSSHRATLTYS